MTMHKNVDMELSAREDPAALMRSWEAQCWIDTKTAEVVRAFRANGIRPILLKGPVIARWLYSEEPLFRSYVDSDLFVAPDQQAAARETLVDIGFERQSMPVLAEDLDNQVFMRSDGANVDLHGTFHGLEEVEPVRVWQVFCAHSVPFTVAGQVVDAPDLALRTLNVVLHLGADDSSATKSWRDLSRAIERVDFDVWFSAAAIARELGAELEMAARLRRVSAGAALADRLGLPDELSVAYKLQRAVAQGHVSPTVVRVHRFVGLRSSPLIAARYAAQKIFPPIEQLRLDYPRLAQAGPGGTVAARIARACRVVFSAPKAVREYLQMAGTDFE